MIGKRPKWEAVLKAAAAWEKGAHKVGGGLSLGRDGQKGGRVP